MFCIMQALALRTNDRFGGPLVTPSGAINSATLRSVFDEFDADKSGAIDAREVQVRCSTRVCVSLLPRL